MDLASLSVNQVKEGLGTRRFSAVELATEALRFAEAGNPKTNAYLHFCPERALEAARRVDQRLARGEDPGPLGGVPVAVKDVILTKGVRSTAGSKLLAHYVPPYDATAVVRLEQAGGVILGKTNCDEFAMGSSNENSAFGPVRNPVAPDRVPGGSSGGSGAVVAQGTAVAALGSDTGGSIRQPASLTGTCGIRPTYGAVSRYGMVAFASSLDQGGAFGKSAEDLALMLNVMAGFDERDSTSIERPKEDYARDLARPLAGLRVGLPKEYFTADLSPDVAACVTAAIAELKAQGATPVEVSLPNQALAVPVYYVIAPAEASSNLSRFDGVRYGHRAAAYDDLRDMYRRTRAEGFGAEVKRRILIGTYVLSHGYYDAYYLKAQQVRRLIADDFRRALATCDVIAGPTTPTPAFPLGDKADDPVQMYLNDIFTVAANLTGLPAMSMPCGFTRDGLPVGLQLHAAHFGEARLLEVAHRYQQATDWHQRVPPGAE